MTRRFFFKSPIRGVKIAKKSPPFLENYLKSPEFWAKIAAQTQFFSCFIAFLLTKFLRVL